MSIRRRQQDTALEELYARIPEIPDCQGKCWISCGPLEMSDRERARIRSAGYAITPAPQALAQETTFYCEALTGDRRCAVYQLRPVICRLWGVVEGLQCPYGCRPAGGFMSDQDGVSLLAESMRIGGGFGQELPPQDELHQMLGTDRMAEFYRQLFAETRKNLMQQRVLPAGFRRAD